MKYINKNPINIVVALHNSATYKAFKYSWWLCISRNDCTPLFMGQAGANNFKNIVYITYTVNYNGSSDMRYTIQCCISLEIIEDNSQ